MKWIYLIFAILFEVAGTTSMKLSEGFTKPIWSVLLGVFYLTSLYLLTLSLKYFEIGKTYAMWSGLGTTTIAIIGILYFKEEFTWLKIGCILLIILGVVGLNLSTVKH
jgi:small multidrug resistance pump